MDVQVDVKGLKEIEQNLRQLRDDIRDKFLMEAAREGAAVIQTEAQLRAPKDRGFASPKSIVNRIKIRISKPDRFGVIAKIVASAPHSHLMEFGTTAHIIRVKTKKMLSDGKKAFGRLVHHPGNTARPFMRPAFEAKKLEAVQRVAQVLREKIAAFKASNVKKVA